MKPEEIKKALENKLKENKRIYSLDIAFLKKLLDLINQYEAEIERISKQVINLKCENERLKDMVSQNEGVLPRYEQLIKAEARKEFAERLKIRFSGTLQVSGWLIQKVVEDILQEMGVEL